ncbi:MAG TPA: hypothetical protein VF676_00280 [Flavobacterium sp.]
MKATVKIQHLLLASAMMLGISCNQNNNAGNTTAEGTELEDQRPHQNEGSMAGDVDTLTSPGSNAGDIKQGNTGSDPNMQNQSNTHGYDTQRGDNGTGSGGGSATGTTGTGSGSVGSGSTGAASGSGR